MQLITKKKVVRCYPNSHPLFGKLVCSNCGSPYERVTQQYNGKRKKIWRCKRKNGECHNHSIEETVLLAALADYEWESIEKVLIADRKIVEVKLKKRYPPIKPES